MEWKGIKVVVRLSVINRVATPTIVPTASAMIMKELKEPPRDRKKVKNIKHSGNVTLDAIINIARVMRAKSMAKKLVGTVKEVLGTAFSIGCTVNGQSPKDVQASIDSGSITIPSE
jgi:large subunit ribosomal protein L12e